MTSRDSFSRTGPRPEGVDDPPRAAPKGRSSRQGDAIIRALRAQATFRSAQDIHAALRDAGDGVGLTTVYRHLQSLVDSKAIDAVQTAGGETVYRLCASSTHHHHIVCRSCGRSDEIEAPDVERFTESVARDLGYAEVSHTLDIFGICRSCRITGAAPPQGPDVC